MILQATRSLQRVNSGSAGHPVEHYRHGIRNQLDPITLAQVRVTRDMDGPPAGPKVRRRYLDAVTKTPALGRGSISNVGSGGALLRLETDWIEVELR
jgi:hypothetical protein